MAKVSMNATLLMLGMAGLAMLGACSDGGSEANRRGVGAECSKNTDCTEKGQTCLTAFKGGYCGVSPCAHDVDCPQGSACVTEDDGVNYCFLVCTDKAQCNDHRTADNESNCVSSLPFVEATMGRKVCRPPMGGTATPTDGGAG
jgi:hypothetical protein